MEAIDILEEKSPCPSEEDFINLYKMAPPIAAIARGIEDQDIKERMIKYSYSNVLCAHKEIPDYRFKYKRCFVHAYLDALIFTKYISQSKAEKVIDLLESKAVIELR